MRERPVHNILRPPLAHAFGGDRVTQAGRDQAEYRVLLAGLLRDVRELPFAMKHTHDPVVDGRSEIAPEVQDELVVD